MVDDVMKHQPCESTARIVFVCVEKCVELEHGETFVDELNFEEVRAHDDKKELEHREISGAE